MRQALIGAGFSLIGSMRLHRVMPQTLRGIGAILMFHHVRPPSPDRFRPNGLLEITPAFLEAVIVRLRHLGYDIVTLDEAVTRTRNGRSDRPFAVLTFDDGYRDNAVHALPVLERHGAPFTMFVTPGFADRTARLWWVELESAIRHVDTVALDTETGPLRLPSRTCREKQAAWHTIYAGLRQGSEEQLAQRVEQLCARAGVDRAALVADLCLDWDGVLRIAAHPLATIGAHTMTHGRLAKLDALRMLVEIEDSRAVLQRRTGREVRHFAYPVGDPTSAGPREFEAARQLGFDTAVTTRPGLLFADHAAHLHALPRLSINGQWQDLRNVDVLLSGMAFALWNRGRKVNAA